MSEQVSDFEKHANTDRQGLVNELFGFMAESKKWWLMPVLVFMVGAGALVLLAGSGAAPFIYTLF